MGPIRRFLSVCACSVVVVGCGEGIDADPTMTLVAGDYVASDGMGGLSLVTTGVNGDTIDWLASGASIELALDLDGTTSGRMFVPNGDEDGGDFDADLVGTWSIQGSVVRLEHDADTFLRDIHLDYEDGVLRGSFTGDEPFVHVTLVRR